VTDVDLKRGVVVMSDGWVGVIAYDDFKLDTLVCFQVGVRPNDWLMGCRAFRRQKFAKIVARGGVVEWDRSYS
jgi:hypothetical protein